jgi:hypothetical protein
MTAARQPPGAEPSAEAMEMALDWMRDSGRGEPYERRLAGMFDAFAARKVAEAKKRGIAWAIWALREKAKAERALKYDGRWADHAADWLNADDLPSYPEQQVAEAVAAERERIARRVSEQQILRFQVGRDPLVEVNEFIQDLAYEIATDWEDYE